MRYRWTVVLLILGMFIVAKSFTAEKYICDVMSGKVPVCRLTKLAIERHLGDLKRQNTPEFPYYFDPEAAKRVITFKGELEIVEGEYAGARLKMPAWLQFKDWVLFGWRRVDGGYRRFRKAYITVARKNTKTTDAAATALYVFYAERPRERGPQVYCVGPQKAQGKLCWKIAAEMVQKEKELKKRARFFKLNTNEPVLNLTTDSMAVMTVWGKDATTKDGFSPSMAVVDEAHLYPGHEAMEVLESGTGARPQPLIYVITSAGFDLESSCYNEEHRLAVEVLEGTADPVPEHFFALIYTLDEGDDFTDPAVWKKANPSLGDLPTPREDILRERVADALATPTKRNDILTKNFNIWTQTETRWIAPEAWAACCGKVDPEALAGKRAYGGLDLSMGRDLTAWVLCFWPTEEEPDVYPFLYRFFLPKDNIVEREREDKRQYRYWAEQKLLTLTPGPQVDYGLVEKAIRDDAAKYDIPQIAYDPYRAGWLINDLQKRGLTIEMVEYRQGMQTMGPATALFERAIIGKTIAHGDNPIMRWMMACTEIQSDRGGRIMPMKPKRGARGKRIDGVVASIMGYHRAYSEFGKAQAKVEVWAV
ncbi:MAG TPA: terminase TerL endonuclease subunit [Sedimentisphaerales bacterium]|nr:terminase TerL endonuclease subunit [Sedimentisphaerales bacterium]